MCKKVQTCATHVEECFLFPKDKQKILRESSRTNMMVNVFGICTHGTECTKITEIGFGIS